MLSYVYLVRQVDGVASGIEMLIRGCLWRDAGVRRGWSLVQLRSCVVVCGGECREVESVRIIPYQFILHANLKLPMTPSRRFGHVFFHF